MAPGPEVEHVSGRAGLPLARRAHAAATCLVPFHVTVEALAACMIVNTLEHTDYKLRLAQNHDEKSIVLGPNKIQFA